MQDVIEDKPIVNHITEFANPKPKDPLQELTPIDTDLLNAATSFDKLTSLLKELPEVNEARVLYFKAKIELDQYEINNRAIAEKLLED